MSAGKNPYLRYGIIDGCLANKQKRYWSGDELIKKFADQDLFIEMRSLRYDIHNMRYDERLGFMAPIAYCARNRGYYYTDPSYSIPSLAVSSNLLNATDLRVISFAVNIIEQYKGTVLVKQVRTAIDKITNFVKHLRQDTMTNAVIGFEKMPYYKGLDFLDRVLHAVNDEQPLRIVYKKFKNDLEITHIFHPYFLRDYKGRLYVIGYSETRNSIITLGLERFEKLEEASVVFRKNDMLNPEAYFQHTVGVTITPGPVEDVELLFSPEQADYIKTQHLHHTQAVVKEDANGLHICMQLKPNYELLSIILGFGPEVEVLKPLSLRASMVECVRRMAGIYGVK